MSEHRLRRVDRHHPSKTFTGEVKGGAIFGCSGCGWTVVTGGTLQGVKAHAQHVRDLEAAPAAEAEA